MWGDRIFLTAALQDGRKCHVLCLDAPTGRILWNAVVLAAGAEFKILARNPLNERCQALLAVSGGQLFIRSDKHVVRLQ